MYISKPTEFHCTQKKMNLNYANLKIGGWSLWGKIQTVTKQSNIL